MDLITDMEIGTIIHKNVYIRLGIVLLLHLMKGKQIYFIPLHFVINTVSRFIY
jgi:hypothetical protein